MTFKQPKGLKAFVVVWAGQLVSLLGTSMSGFAITIWAWQMTGTATALALVAFFRFGPEVMLAPLAGALVDRWDRKKVLIVSDLVAGISTIIILFLYLGGSLQVWHLFAAGALAGAFQAFQFPAFSASISLMLPKKHYGRASGMMSLAENLSRVMGPMLAVAGLVFIGITGIFFIDIFTFIIAVVTLYLVSIPRPKETEDGRKGKGNILKESTFGFRYIYQRPSLVGLLWIFFGINFFATLGFIVLQPMILARTGRELILGSVMSAGAVGGVVGGVLMSIWGGPKRRINGILIGLLLEGVLGGILMGLNGGVYLWIFAAFNMSVFIPIINGSSQAIWQAKVAPDVQGRVFAARMMLAMIASPVAMVIAGPLADNIFEPAMQSDGALPTLFGGLVGTGPGTGMALMFIVFGICQTVVGLLGYVFPVIRNVEDILPDHKQSEDEVEEKSGTEKRGKRKPRKLRVVRKTEHVNQAAGGSESGTEGKGQK